MYLNLKGGVKKYTCKGDIQSLLQGFFSIDDSFDFGILGGK